MSIEINATIRNDLGKGASRRLRRSGQVPGIIYGGAEPQSINIEHRELWKAQSDEAFYASVLNLIVDGKPQAVVIKDMQRHPAKPLDMHVDFQRTDSSAPIVVDVPLHYINGEISPAVKLQGGSIQVVAQTLKVRCLPANLPAFITVDLANVNAGQILHISDVQLPEGVVSVALQSGADRNHPVALINGGRTK